jgi:DnaJ-class molecular chaperone
LDGRNITIKSKEVVSHGVIKTVKDLGMPFYEQPQKFGNLYLKICVVFPEKVETSQREEFFRLFAEQANKENISGDIQEKYYLSEFVKIDENTHHGGGRVEDRRHGEY